MTLKSPDNYQIQLHPSCTTTTATTTMTKYTVYAQKRINSVLQQNNLISKPEKPTDKAIQTGRSLVVSRGRPNHCVLCTERHSYLACPTLNPVSEDSQPTTTTFNPDGVRPRMSSKCNNCKVLDHDVTTSSPS